MIAFLPMSLPASWLIDTRGFRFAVGLGSAVMGVCGVLRGLAGDSYPLALAATCGIALAQPLLLTRGRQCPRSGSRPGSARPRWASPRWATSSAPRWVWSSPPPCWRRCRSARIQLIYGVVAAASAVLFLLVARERPADPDRPGRRAGARAGARRPAARPAAPRVLGSAGDLVRRPRSLQRRDHLDRGDHPAARPDPRGRRDVGRGDARPPAWSARWSCRPVRPARPTPAVPGAGVRRGDPRPARLWRSRPRCSGC